MSYILDHRTVWSTITPNITDAIGNSKICTLLRRDTSPAKQIAMNIHLPYISKQIC